MLIAWTVWTRFKVVSRSTAAQPIPSE